MKEELFDAAYTLTRDMHIPGAQAQAEVNLQELFPQVAGDSITEALAAGSKLRGHADWAGGRGHEGKWPDDEAVTYLREQCPGFSEATYSRALGQGWIDNR